MIIYVKIRISTFAISRSKTYVVNINFIAIGFATAYNIIISILKIIIFLFQFFGNTVKSAMETLSNTAEADQGLKNCNGSLAFIERFNKLIDIMNSKTPAAALWKRKNEDINCTEEEDDSFKSEKIKVNNLNA